MDKLDVLTRFLGSLEPSTWITDRGVSAWLLVLLLFCGFVFLRDGMRNGALSLLRYVMGALAFATTVFLIY